MTELEDGIQKGCFIKTGWCGSSECEKGIKEKTAATIRNIPFDQEGFDGKCVYCGKEHSTLCYVARAY